MQTRLAKNFIVFLIEFTFPWTSIFSNDVENPSEIDLDIVFKSCSLVAYPKNFHLVKNLYICKRLNMSSKSVIPKEHNIKTRK